jgi:hypothetical protein
MKRLLIVAVMAVSSLSLAQAPRNRIERANDRQDLRQDNRQLADDRMDAARAAQLLTDYDAAAARNDAARLGQLDVAFTRHLERELAESRVESAQARQEVREDKRELRGDRRELNRDFAQGRGPGVKADDARDLARDRADLADDRRDAAKERVSRERLLAVQAQLAGLTGRFDAGSVSQKRALYAEVLAVAVNEVHRDKVERREDRRELREDRRETREDRRQRR